jgi:peptidoglycan/LPS O-acetylase OafA/YrhL
MNATDNDKPRMGRFIELDSLRGVAALTVVFHHFKLLWGGTKFSKAIVAFVWIPVKLISAGHEAVILFFLLSGFVLCIPFLRGKAQPYRVFLTRRIFRIYFPYLAALALAVAGDAALHGYLSLSPWFHETWNQPVDWKLVCQHVMFLGKYDNMQFNTAFWSLVIEMRVSIVFPALCLVAMKLKPAHSLALATLLTTACAYLNPFFPDIFEILLTVHYASIFIVGIFLARQQKQISAFYLSLSRPVKFVSLALCTIFYAYGDAIVRREHGLVSDWLPIVGAAGIVIFSLNSGLFRRILLTRPVRFLGEISYSVYLLHGTILFTLVHLLYGRVLLLAILPLYLSLVIGASTAFHYLVERPSMSWGRRAGSYLMPAKPDAAAVPVA